MNRKRQPHLLLRVAPEPPAPVVQAMPGRRVRLNPDAIPDLAAFLCALAEPVARMSRRTLRGLKGHARVSMKGQIAWAKAAAEGIQRMVNNLTECVGLDDFDHFRTQFIAGAERRAGRIDPDPAA